MSTNLEEHARTIVEKLTALSVAIDEATRAVAERTEVALRELEPWLDKRQAARYLAMAVSTLEGRMASRNPPPHTNDGGKVRFKPSELDQWMRQWTVHYRRRNC
jgi:excisionase family DNA binding protein